MSEDGMLARFDRARDHPRLTKAALERPQISSRPGKSHLDHLPTSQERARFQDSVYAVVERVTQALSCPHDTSVCLRIIRKDTLIPNYP
jgi:hypothetical protein